MAVNDSIKKMFQLYVGKHFSEQSRALFGNWLRAETDQQEKEKLLQQLWLKSEGPVTNETRNDWVRLKNQMDKSADRHYLHWLKYAAVVVLFIASVGGAYWAAVQTTLHQPIEMTELFVPYGETREITLPDSSKVWINAGSTVVYPKNFEKMNSRSVYLIGEASFFVTKDKDKPFIVKTSTMDVQALGTVFTVEAYPDEEETSATLEEGRVRVSLKDKRKDSYILSPREQLVYSHKDGLVTRNRVDTEAFEKIRKGYLIFEDVTFRDIISTIEKKYGVIIHYNSTRYGYDLYNIKFSPDESIENVMNILHQLIEIKYTIQGKHIIIK